MPLVAARSDVCSGPGLHAEPENSALAMTYMLYDNSAYLLDDSAYLLDDSK